MATEISKDQVVDFLSQMPVIQLAELIKTLEDKWGVKAAPVAVAAGPMAAGGGAPPAGGPAVQRRLSLSTQPRRRYTWRR